MTLPAVRRRLVVPDDSITIPVPSRHRNLAAWIGVAGGTRWYTVQRAINVGGNAPSRPLYTLTYPAGSDYTITEIKIANLSLPSAPTIDIVYAFTPGQALLVDCVASTAKIAGALVDYAGTFPLLDPRVGVNIIQFQVYAAAKPSLTPQIDWTARWAS